MIFFLSHYIRLPNIFPTIYGLFGLFAAVRPQKKNRIQNVGIRGFRGAAIFKMYPSGEMAAPGGIFMISTNKCDVQHYTSRGRFAENFSPLRYRLPGEKLSHAHTFFEAIAIISKED